MCPKVLSSHNPLEGELGYVAMDRSCRDRFRPFAQIAPFQNLAAHRRTKTLFFLPMTLPTLMMLFLWTLSISQSSKSLHVIHFTFIYILYYLSSQILSALVRLHVKKLRKLVVVSSENFLEVFHYSRFSF